MKCTSPCPDTAQVVIQVEGLTKRYEGVLAVDSLSFAIRRGSVTALLGGNGAGKTSTIAMLLGLLIPTSGRVEVLGHDMSRHRHRALPLMNYASPYVDLPHRLTVKQNLHIYGKLYGLSDVAGRIAELAETFSFADLLSRDYGSLSAGQKTRVSLAKALLNRPQVLLLDEPTASLDPDTGDRMRSLLAAYVRENDSTLLMASHNMLEVERLCDDVLIMQRGHLVDRGAPAALVHRYGRASLEQVFLDVARSGTEHG